MRKIYLFLALGSGLFLCSEAQAQKSLSDGVLKSSRVAKMEWAGKMKENADLWNTSRPTKNFTLDTKFRTPSMLLSKSKAPAETVVLSEDFSKFTAGSEEMPDAQDLTYLEETGMNIPGEYTSIPGWMGEKVYQAGGCGFIDHTVIPGDTEENNIYIQGCLYTPVLDLSGNNGIFTVSFRARTKDKSTDVLRIQEYVQQDDYYRYMDQEIDLTIDSEWKTYTVAINRGCAANRICFVTNTSNWYIDDVKIESAGLQQPAGVTDENYTGTGVTLKWDAVEGATSYLVDLYYKDENGNKVYKLKDAETTETSYTATDLVVENTYYCRVRAKNTDGVSPYSDEYAILSDLVSPDLLPCTDYAGTSFTANWEPVEGATSYLVSVYNLVEDYYTLVPNYLIRQEETTGTSMKIEGCDPSLTYYYTVQSKGAGVSPESEYVMPAVPQLTAPKLLEPTNVTTNGFTANWEEVPYSDGYTPFLYKEHTALEDQKLSLIDTDFSDAVCPPSYDPWGDMTITEPFQSFAPYYFDEFAGMADWYINVTAFANGAVGLDNLYPDFFDQGYMISPKLDFSLGDGSVTIDVDWLSIPASYLTEVSAMVAFATVGPDNSINIEGEPQVFNVPVGALSHETITLKGGKPDSYLVFFTPDNAIIMFDKLKVEMGMNKDEKILLPIKSLFTEDTSMDFKDLDVTPGDRYGYNVSSAYIGDGTFVYQTGASDMQFVDLVSTSINDMTIDNGAEAYVKDGKLYVKNPNNEPVSIYNANGIQIVSATIEHSKGVYDLPATGLYIVKVGDKVIKVVR